MTETAHRPIRYLPAFAAALVLGALLGGLASLAPDVADGGTASTDDDGTFVVLAIVMLVLALLQAGYVAGLFRVLELQGTGDGRRRRTLFVVAHWVAVVVVGVFAAVAVLLYRSSLGEGLALSWVAVAIVFVSSVSTAAESHWRERAGIRREIAAFLIATSVTTFLALLFLAVALVEISLGEVGGFGENLAVTASVSSTVMAVPAAAWIVFLLRQPGRG